MGDECDSFMEVEAGMEEFAPPIVTQGCPIELRMAHEKVSWRREHFRCLRQLGAGKTSIVYEAECIYSKQIVAMKQYAKAKLTANNVTQVRREMAIHTKLQHGHVLPLYACFEDEETFVFILKFAEKGDLFREVRLSGGFLTEQRCARGVVAPILVALSYMHGEGVIHRDLKPENIVIDSEGAVLVADFGLSIDCGLERPVTRLGTLDFMAPEVLRCPDKVPRAPPAVEPLYDGKVDAWAVGVIAFETLAGHSPFTGPSKQGLCDNICTKAPLQLPEHISSSAKDFVAKALAKKTSRRWGVDELMEHPWVARWVQIMTRPRDGCEEASARGGPASPTLRQPASPAPVATPAGSRGRIAQSIRSFSSGALCSADTVLASIATDSSAKLPVSPGGVALQGAPAAGSTASGDASLWQMQQKLAPLKSLPPGKEPSGALQPPPLSPLSPGAAGGGGSGFASPPISPSRPPSRGGLASRDSSRHGAKLNVSFSPEALAAAVEAECGTSPRGGNSAKKRRGSKKPTEAELAAALEVASSDSSDGVLFADCCGLVGGGGQKRRQSPLPAAGAGGAAQQQARSGTGAPAQTAVAAAKEASSPGLHSHAPDTSFDAASQQTTGGHQKAGNPAQAAAPTKQAQAAAAAGTPAVNAAPAAKPVQAAARPAAAAKPGKVASESGFRALLPTAPSLGSKSSAAVLAPASSRSGGASGGGGAEADRGGAAAKKPPPLTTAGAADAADAAAAAAAEKEHRNSQGYARLLEKLNKKPLGLRVEVPSSPGVSSGGATAGGGSAASLAAAAGSSPYRLAATGSVAGPGHPLVSSPCPRYYSQNNLLSPAHSSSSLSQGFYFSPSGGTPTAASAAAAAAAAAASRAESPYSRGPLSVTAVALAAAASAGAGGAGGASPFRHHLSAASPDRRGGGGVATAASHLLQRSPQSWSAGIRRSLSTSFSAFSIGGNGSSGGGDAAAAGPGASSYGSAAGLPPSGARSTSRAAALTQQLQSASLGPAGAGGAADAAVNTASGGRPSGGGISALAATAPHQAGFARTSSLGTAGQQSPSSPHGGYGTPSPIKRRLSAKRSVVAPAQSSPGGGGSPAAGGAASASPGSGGRALGSRLPPTSPSSGRASPSNMFSSGYTPPGGGAAAHSSDGGGGSGLRRSVGDAPALGGGGSARGGAGSASPEPAAGGGGGASAGGSWRGSASGGAAAVRPPPTSATGGVGRSLSHFSTFNNTSGQYDGSSGVSAFGDPHVFGGGLSPIESPAEASPQLAGHGGSGARAVDRHQTYVLGSGGEASAPVWRPFRSPASTPAASHGGAAGGAASAAGAKAKGVDGLGVWAPSSTTDPRGSVRGTAGIGAAAAAAVAGGWQQTRRP